MIITKDLLMDYGGVIKRFKKNELIFHEGENPRYLYYLESGKVKMYSTNDEGKEFTQGFFSPGSTFGEPPLLINEKYPATAIATVESDLIKLLKADFFRLLDENPLLQRDLLTLFAARVYEKSIAAKEIINHSPEERILAFLKTYKRKFGKSGTPILVEHTRQEIANFTGLCVETVIRTISKMHNKKQVEINNRKIYF